MGPTYYCWHCYAGRAAPDGVCERCGHAADTPTPATYVDRLLWALRHPLPERRLLAIKVLGTRGEPRAVPHLRALATDTDPYLAATAVTALVSITGVDAERDLLIELARTGPAPVRWAARQALSRS